MEVERYAEPLVCRIIAAVECGYKICVILRGLPGRGKTSMAHYIRARVSKQGLTVKCVAADDFMVDGYGQYLFQTERLAHAHHSCTRELAIAIADGVDVAVQHNTNTLAWESEAVRAIAVANGYIVIIAQPEFAWTHPDQLPRAMQGVLVSEHGVSQQKIVEMLSRKVRIAPVYIGCFVTKKMLFAAINQSGLAGEVEQLLGDLTTKIPEMLHITMSFIGMKPTKECQSAVLQYLHSNALTHMGLMISAIAVDPVRGAFAVVLDEGLEDYQKFNDINDQQRLPHITLAANKDVSNVEMNTATALFHTENCDFPRVLFNPPLRLDGILAGSYMAAEQKFKYFTWSFENDALCEEFQQLMASGNARIVTATVPTEIFGSSGWMLADLSAAPPKGRTDDQVYENSEFLRKHLPRGLCYLIDPNGLARKVIIGLTKFTGDEDDVDGQGACNRYFTAPPEMTTKVLAMEKANGEAAHASIIIIENRKYFLCGSKHVHLITRPDCIEDIELYTDDRFQYAREIAQSFYSIVANTRASAIERFAQCLLDEKSTAIFEYENPNHAHIVPFQRTRLKFITLARGDPATGVGSQLTFSPLQTLTFVEQLGLECVWHFVVPVDQLNELKRTLLIYDNFVFEGSVLYHLDDGGHTIGLVKSKNASYICSRAIREKIALFCRKAQDSVQATVSSSAISQILVNIRSCNDAGRQKQPLNLVRTLAQRLGADRERVVQLLMRRFKDLTADYVQLTPDSSESWTTTATALIDSMVTNIIDEVTPRCNEIVRVIESQFDHIKPPRGNTNPDNAFSLLDEEDGDSGDDTVIETSSTEVVTAYGDDSKESSPNEGGYFRQIRRICQEIEQALVPFTEAAVRNRWPFIWASHVEHCSHRPFNELRET